MSEITEVEAYIGLEPQIIFATIFYSIIGIILMMSFVFIFDRIYTIDMKKELLEDQNMAMAILLGSVFLSVSIIIASAI